MNGKTAIALVCSNLCIIVSAVIGGGGFWQFFFILAAIPALVYAIIETINAWKP